MSLIKNNPMRSGNKFKLGVFGANADGCLSITKHPDRWMAEWDDVVAAAQIADRAGLDFFLPLARWKGFGGETNARHISYETFTFAAALSGLTQQIALFATFNTHEDAAATIVDFRARVKKTGGNAGLFAPVHVVCRPTTTEAEDYYESYAITQTDNAAVDQHMAMKKKMSGSHDPAAYDLYRKRFAGGAGSYPLIGTPGQIADEMIRLNQLGFGGLALSFVNPKDELLYFCDHVLPLLTEAGLRQ